MKRFFVVVLVIMGMMSIPLPVGAYVGTAVCEWTPPTSFEDGSPLVPAVDLSGFRVKCGQTHGGPYPNIYDVVGGSVTTKSVSIPVGTTYCIVTAVTTSVYGSLESANSPEGSKTIVAPPAGGCKTFIMR